MRYKIAFKKSVARDLRKIDRKQVKHILEKIEEDLSSKAGSYPVLTGKFAGLRKFRVGNYRIIYAISGDTALILRISHRKEAYR